MNVHPLSVLPRFIIKAFLSTAVAVSLVNGAQASDLAGFERFDLRTAHRASLIQGSVWYPVSSKTYRGLIGDNILFKGTMAYVGAGIAQGRHPLILLSHGSGGNMDALSWLSSSLALKGAIVLAVNHPGSTSGDSSPLRSLSLGKRARDLTAALDQALADPVFSRFVDPSRIYALGFSLGGGTALNLGGLRFDRAAYHIYCEQFDGTLGGKQLEDCAFFTKGNVDFSALPEDFSADGKDDRIKAVVAVDPGFSYAVAQDSLASLSAPTMLLSLGEEDRLVAADVSKTGSNLVNRLPNATNPVIAPANHFTFLAECKEQGPAILNEEGEDPVCTDPKGAHRGSVHQRIIDKIVTFLRLQK